MTDRELLEAAARAAGVFLTPEKFAAESSSPWDESMAPTYVKHAGCMRGYRAWVDSDGEIGGWESFEWNSLNSDGDCARMEAALGLDVTWHHEFMFVMTLHGDEFFERFADHSGDRNAARRRASTRAAASMDTGEGKR